jgi:hypothetical protein
MALQIRRGTNAERQQIIPLQGELLFTTDTKKLWVGDGVTQGGVAVDALTGSGGGASSISELTDVNITSPTNGQVLKWNGAAWINAADLQGETGATALEELENVDIDSLTDGQILRWDNTSSSWINSTETIPVINQLGGVTINAPTTGQVLKFDGLNWINDEDATAESTVSVLTDLEDISLVALAQGQVLKWNGIAWFNADDETGVGGGASVLSDLNDVFIVGTPTDGQVLKYFDGEWTNAEEAIPVFSVVADESPNLGGSLNLNEFEIFGNGNIDIVGDITISGILSNGEFSVTSNSVSVGASATLNFTDAYDINFADEREESINEGRINVAFNSTDFTRTLRISRYSPNGDFHNKIIGITQGNLAAGNIYEASNGTLLEPTALVPGDAITVNAALGYDNDVTEPSYVISSIIRQSVDVNGVVSSGAVPGRIELLTIADGSLSSTKGLIVDSRGFVSINKGDNIATAELDVLGSVKASVSLIPGVYADTAARDTAIPTPTAGMMIFVTDVTKFQGYNGTAWVDLN